MARLLPDWVSEQAQQRADVAAVVLQDERLSYGELETWSNRLARTLREQGCARGDRVCLLMPKSPLAIASLVGIYKAGCLYVPLDPSGPVSRLAKIVASCEPRCLIAAGDTAALLMELLGQPGGGSPRIGWVDPRGGAPAELSPAFGHADVQGMPPGPVNSSHRSSDAAHILFTSGSTGTPKGVVISHANVLAFVEWAKRYFRLDASDRLSGHPPLSFDLSMFDIFGSFAAGAELHLVPPECNLLPQRMADWIRASGITQWFSVPAALSYMAKFDVVDSCDFPELRRVLWCGEVLPTSVLLYWMKRLPHAAFTNLYGPTEATIASSYYTVDSFPPNETTPIPIGRPCEGEELLVLDREFKPLPAQETGDLYIAGAGLSAGYWRDPQHTVKAFLTITDADGRPKRVYRTGDLAYRGEDGLIYFVGREDTQIKSRGYRIELGEIETALNSVDELRECAVIALPGDSFEGHKVCCAYVPKDRDGVTTSALRTRLSRMLPEYMIPSQWWALDALPRNAAGKIDRRRLKETWIRDAAGTPAH
ncbi:MAG: amino acid adenylation domain-containing protein [Bacillota bacterium]